MVCKASGAEPRPRPTVNSWVAVCGEPIRMANRWHDPVSLNLLIPRANPGPIQAPSLRQRQETMQLRQVDGCEWAAGDTWRRFWNRSERVGRLH